MIDLVSEKLLSVADAKRLLNDKFDEQTIRGWMEPERAESGKPVLESTRIGGRIFTTVRALNEFQRPIESNGEAAGEDDADRILREEHGITVGKDTTGYGRDKKHRGRRAS